MDSIHFDSDGPVYAYNATYDLDTGQLETCVIELDRSEESEPILKGNGERKSRFEFDLLAQAMGIRNKVVNRG